MATLALASPAAAARKEEQLAARLRDLGSVLVAFSAGVDSAYLLDVAHATLGDRAVAVTADSPSLARTSLAEAEAFCADRGIRHLVVATDEFLHEEYLANDGQRCRHCKSALLRAMNGLAERTAGGTALLLGVIADDFGDVRPGLRAAEEAGALFPLAEAGMSKADVRLRSRARGLSTWDRPAEPCLSSRVPYGERVTPAGLRMIEAAEAQLRALGLRECRARHHQVGGGRGALCRIEVPVADLDRVMAAREQVVGALRRIGYVSVALDLAGLVSGGLNALLTDKELHGVSGHGGSHTLNLDLDRLRRCGFPEVVYGAGKTPDEVVSAARRLVDAHGQVLVTRAEAPALDALRAALPSGEAYARSGCFSLGAPEPTAGPVGVLSAGTSDEPVAEEAAVTLAARGVRAERFADCGVAGLHRVLGHVERLRACSALIVIAGMDGALPSVVTGLVDVPVIGCPTSVGYGVAEGGRAALNAMLASCAAGLVVVNVDNGFGAAYAAATIAHRIARTSR